MTQNTYIHIYIHTYQCTSSPILQKYSRTKSWSNNHTYRSLTHPIYPKFVISEDVLGVLLVFRHLSQRQEQEFLDVHIGLFLCVCGGDMTRYARRKHGGRSGFGRCRWLSTRLHTYIQQDSKREGEEKWKMKTKQKLMKFQISITKINCLIFLLQLEP